MSYGDVMTNGNVGAAQGPASGSAPLLSTVNAASSLVAHLLYVLANQETDCEGLLYGTRRKRLKRDVTDHVDGFGQETYEENLTIRRFCILGVGHTFYNAGLQIDESKIKKALKLPLDDNCQSGPGPDFYQNYQNLYENQTFFDKNLDLIGWFSFNRSFADCFLTPYSHVTKQLADLASCQQSPGGGYGDHKTDQQMNMLFLSAFEREIGSDVKLDLPETVLRMHRYDYVEDRLKPVSLRVCNVGNTSHAEYAGIVERDWACYGSLAHRMVREALTPSKLDELYQSTVQLGQHAAFYIRQEIMPPNTSTVPVGRQMRSSPLSPTKTPETPPLRRPSGNAPSNLASLPSSPSPYIDLNSAETKAAFLEPSFLNSSDEMSNLAGRGQKRDKGDASCSSSANSDDIEGALAGLRSTRADTRKRSKNEETEIKSKGRGRKNADS